MGFFDQFLDKDTSGELKRSNFNKYKWALRFNKISNIIKSIEYKQRANFNREHWHPLYESYLQSPEWENKRNQAINIHGSLCVFCGSEYKDIHHLSYERVGNECVETDLVPLCRKCHGEIHGKTRASFDYFMSDNVINLDDEDW